MQSIHKIKVQCRQTATQYIMCKVFLIQYSRVDKTINAQQSVHRNVHALEYLGECSKLALSVCFSCENINYVPITVKSTMHQSTRGANTKNTTFPEHLSLSMEIIAACSPLHRRLHPSVSANACPSPVPWILGVHEVRSVCVSITHILQCTSQHLVDCFRWNSSLSLFLASIMNKDKARQFSLSLPESVHSLIPRYGSSRHLLGSIRRKMLAETGSSPSTAETTAIGS